MSLIDDAVDSAPASGGHQRRRPWRPIVYVVCALLCIPLAFVLYLSVVLPPGSSNLLHYEGAYLLPTHGLVNVLDYLTISGSDLVVAGESSGSFFKISLAPRSLPLQEMTGTPEAHGMAVVPDLQIGFATRSGAESQVDIVDLRNMSLLSSIPLAEDADSILYDPRSRLIYVANGDANLGTVIDPHTRSVLGTVTFAGSPEGSIMDSVSGLLLQNLKSRNSLAAVDLKKRVLQAEWPLSGCQQPSGIAIDSAARRVFSACSGNARLVIFDLDKHQVISSVGIVKRPDAIAFDSGLRRIYAAGIGGALSIVLEEAPNRYRLGDNIRTHYGAHTVTVDEATHRVYVGYASLITQPRVAVFSAIYLHDNQ